jgi:nucleoside-diphosphate-sugar epimerase
MTEMMSHYKNKKVLVTGGSGFIGGCLIEELIGQYSAKIRVMVSNYTNIARIAKYPIEIMKADILDLESVGRAMEGIDIVYHCAYGNKGDDVFQRRVNVEGTQNILIAALKHKPSRIIYTSTSSVYELSKHNEINELSSKIYSGDVYNDSKLDAETLVGEYIEKHDLPVVIVQPTIVYGPYAPVWTINILNKLKKYRFILINDGEGLCNALFIDDLIQALLLAGFKKEAIGETFLISGSKPTTWAQYINAYEKILGIDSTIIMTYDEAVKHAALQVEDKRKKKKSAFSRFHPKHVYLKIPLFVDIKNYFWPYMPVSIRDAMKLEITRKKNLRASKESNKQVMPLSQSMIELFTSKSSVSIKKAITILGYRPVYNLKDGMEVTEQWAKWANQIN